MTPGEIDRTTEHEKVPFLERTKTPEGVVRELYELHRLVVEQHLLPEGSDVAQRFSLLMGITMGTVWRLLDRAGVRLSPAVPGNLKRVDKMLEGIGAIAARARAALTPKEREILDSRLSDAPCGDWLPQPQHGSSSGCACTLSPGHSGPHENDFMGVVRRWGNAEKDPPPPCDDPLRSRLNLPKKDPK